MRNNAPLLSASWSGSEIEVTFSATSQRNDFGVPGSPVWFEPEDVKIQSLTILGVETDPAKLPDPIHAALMELSQEIEDWGLAA